MEIFLILQRLVNIPSYDNESEVQGYLKSLLDRLGFVTMLSDVRPGRPNLWASRGIGGPLIVSHADTFPQDDHPDPLHLRDLDGGVVGRGAIDAKGQIAALIKALSMSTKPCTILITVDEERCGRGSEVTMPHVDGALVLEPTELGIAVAQAGFIEAAIRTHGRSAHGSTPEAGDNAILKALGLYEKLHGLSFMKASHPLFPPPWLNLQWIKGGSERAVVPSSCTMQTDICVLPGVDFAAALEEFERFVDGEQATCRIIDSSPPIETDPSARVASTLSAAFQQATGITPKLVGMRSWTDAANIMKRGIPTAVFGAGDLALAHSSREEIDTDDLEILASVLATFIDFW